jgi:hypothetical protein
MSCKHDKTNVFNKVGMEISGYDVTKYIYTTHDINFLNQIVSSYGRWIGYLAISSNNFVRKLGRKRYTHYFQRTIINPKSIGNLMSSEWLQPPPMLIEHNLFHPQCHWGLSHDPWGFVMGDQSPTDFHFV